MLRRLHVLVCALALGLAQIHVPVSTYVDAAGASCAECAGLTDGAESSQDHGDCHDCCVRSSTCGDDHHSTRATHGQPFIAVLPARLVFKVTRIETGPVHVLTDVPRQSLGVCRLAFVRGPPLPC